MGTEQLHNRMRIDMIAYLRQFILDSYSTGFAILQELVQNANDANSEKLVIELVKDGIKDAHNPLLRNPFVLVSNDGPFKEKDEQAIFNIGVGSKRGDTKTIGKYGLGMKSLFHWADVLIFFNKDKFGILNPFAFDDSGESEHSTWNGDEQNKVEDINKLKEIVRKRFKKDNYFSLFIPLRQDDDNEHIENSYYPADSIVNLFSIKADNSSSKGDFLTAFSEVLATIHYTSQMEKKLSRISLYSENENIEASLKNDSIEIFDSSYKEPIVVSCHSYSCLRNIDDIRAVLKTSSSWPTIRVDNDKHDGKQLADTLYALGSAYIVLKRTETDDRKRRLKVMWASYLPLKDDKQIREFSIEGKYSYTIIINSSFCTDSGRNRINGFVDMLTPLACDITPEYVKEIKYVPQMESLWNQLILHNILLPDFTEMLFSLRKDLNIRSKDDFNALLKASRLQSFVKDKISVIYSASTAHKVILYQDDDDYTLDWRISVPEENTFTSPVPSDKLLAHPVFQDVIEFIKQYGPLCFENSSRISYRDASVTSKFKRDDYFINILLSELCDNKYRTLYGLNDFSAYLAELLRKYPNIEYLSELRTLLRKMIVYYLDEGKVFPVDFKENLLKVSYDYCSDDVRGERTYFLKSSGQSNLVEKGNQLDSSFIFIPNSYKYGFEPVIQLYPDPNQYLNACLNEVITQLDEEFMPAAFSEMILSIIPQVTLKLRMFDWIKTIFADLPVIPVEHYVQGKPKTIYKSYSSLGEIYKAPGVQFNTVLNLLYSFIPDFPELDCITDPVCTRYGLKDLDRVPFSVIDILESAYRRGCILSPVRSMAEDFLSELIGNNSEIAIRIIENKLPLFPTTDGGMAALSMHDPSVLIDLNGLFRNFHAKDASFRIVYPTNETLKKKIRDYSIFSDYIINRGRALEFYLDKQNPEYYDSREILNLLENTDYLYQQSTSLTDVAWFEYAGKLYAPSNIIMPGILSETTERAFSRYCLILGEDELENPDIRLLYDKGLIVDKIDQISLPLLNNIFCGSAIISLSSCDPDIREILIEAMSSLSYVCPLSCWGSFLKDYEKSAGTIPPQILSMRNVLPEEMQIQQWVDVLLKLGEWSRSAKQKNSRNKEAFIYVMNTLSYSNLIQIVKAAHGKEMLFPSQGTKWSILDELCDPEHYDNIDPEHLLISGISIIKDNNNKWEVNDYEKTSGNTSLAASFEPAGFSDLLAAWPTAHQALIAMLLFVCRAFDQYDTCIDVVGGEQILLQKLSGYSARDTHKNDFLGLTKEEVFSPKKPRVHVPQVILTLNNGDRFPVVTLTGKHMEVDTRLNANSGKIFISDKAPFKIAYKKYYFILPAQNLQSKQINELIVNLIQTILERVYCQTYGNSLTPRDFREELRTLATSSQQDRLKVTQDQIMRFMDQTLRTLKVCSEGAISKEIRQILNENDQLENDLSQCRVSSRDLNIMKQVNNKLDSNRQKIVDMLAADDSTGRKLRDFILKMIRNKLGNNQYSERSVLFEFFQNADDAALQLQKADKKAENKDFYFMVSHDESKLLIKHNGRNINLDPYNSGHPEWRLDLRNMLRFNISNKNEDDLMGETGTYGLGFKSCYFITDEPRIHSGITISTRICGGIYPIDDNTPANVANDETLFVLPYKEGKNKTNIESDVISPFVHNLAGIMLFSKCISEFIVDGRSFSNSDSRKITEDIYIQTIDNNSYLKIKLMKGEVVFALGSTGIKKLDPDVSPFWKTQPLQKLKGPSYMVNSNLFMVDTGRNTLCDNACNEEIIESIGEELGTLIASLFNNKTDIVTGVEFSTICSQMINLMSEGINEVDRTFAHSFFISFYEKFVRCTGYCYTGYKNRFLAMTSSLNRCCVVNSALGLKTDTDSLVAAMDAMFKNVCDGNTVIFRRKAFIPKVFEKLVYMDISSIEKIYEACGIDHVIKADMVDAVKVFGDFICNHEGYFNWNDFRFNSLQGIPHKLNMLIDRNDSDLAAIAPNEFRLSLLYPEYINGSLDPDLATLARWIDSAKTEAARKAAAIIVERHPDVVKYMDKNSWFLRDHDSYVREMSKDTRDLVKKQIDERHDKVNYLAQIYDIWDRMPFEDRKVRIEDYRNHIFGKKELDLSDSENDDWLRLLCIAASQTLGRTSDTAIFNFVNYFIKSYRTLKLGQPGSREDSRKWMNFIIYKEMSHNDGQYEHWRKLLPAFAQIVMCKDDLYSLWVEGTSFDPKKILNAKACVELDEYDYELPDLRNNLGHFMGIVIRELLASGIEIEDRKSLVKRCLYFSTHIQDKFNMNHEMTDEYHYLLSQGVSESMISKHYDYPLWTEVQYDLEGAI